MKTLKYIFICAAAALALSCGGKKGAMAPEEVVETFTRAIAAGDFSAARVLCDTVSMNAYLENCRQAMDAVQKEDCCVFAIAAAMLEGAEFEVSGVLKEGNERTVLYQIGTCGCTKAKKAVLKKEEGEWKLREITDAL